MEDNNNVKKNVLVAVQGSFESNQFQFLPYLQNLNEPILKEKKIYVVSIAGPQNTGKSTLANFIAKKSKFDIGDTGSHCTLGLWFTILEHPTRTDSVILLLDCQGTGSNDSVDNRLIIAIMLLSHAVIYNIKATWDASSSAISKTIAIVKAVLARKTKVEKDRMIVDNILILKRDFREKEKRIKKQIESHPNPLLQKLKSFELPPLVNDIRYYSGQYEQLQANANEEFVTAVSNFWEKEIVEKMLNFAKPVTLEDFTAKVNSVYEVVLRNEDVQNILKGGEELFYNHLVNTATKKLDQWTETFLQKLFPLPFKILKLLWNKRKKLLNPDNDIPEVQEKLSKYFDSKFEIVKIENAKKVIKQKWEVLKEKIKETMKEGTVSPADVRKLIELLKQEILVELKNLKINIPDNFIEEILDSEAAELISDVSGRYSPSSSSISYLEILGRTIKGWVNKSPFMRPDKPEFVSAPAQPQVEQFKAPEFKLPDNLKELKLGGGTNKLGGRKTRVWEIRDPETNELLGRGTAKKHHSEARDKALRQAESVLKDRFNSKVASAKAIHESNIKSLNEQYAKDTSEWKLKKAQFDTEFDEKVKTAEVEYSNQQQSEMKKEARNAALLTVLLGSKPHLIDAFVNFDTKYGGSYATASKEVAKKTGWSLLQQSPMLVAMALPLMGFAPIGIPTALCLQIGSSFVLNLFTSSKTDTAVSLASQVASIGAMQIPYATYVYLAYSTYSEIKQAKKERSEILKAKESEMESEALVRALTLTIPFDITWPQILSKLESSLLNNDPKLWAEIMKQLPQGTRLVENTETKQWNIHPIHYIQLSGKLYEWGMGVNPLFSVTINNYDVAFSDINIHNMITGMMLSRLSITSNNPVPLVCVYYGFSKADKLEKSPQQNKPVLNSPPENLLLFAMKEYPEAKSLIQLSKDVVDGDTIQTNFNDLLTNILIHTVLGIASLQQLCKLVVFNLSPENLMIVKENPRNYNYKLEKSTFEFNSFGYLPKIRNMEYSRLIVGKYTLSNKTFITFLSNQTSAQEPIIRNYLNRVPKYSETWDLHILFRRLARETTHDLWRHPIVTTFWALEAREAAIKTGKPLEYEPILSEELESAFPNISDFKNDLAIHIPLGNQYLTAASFAKYLQEDNWLLEEGIPAWPAKLTEACPKIDKKISTDQDLNIDFSTIQRNWDEYFMRKDLKTGYTTDLFPEISNIIAQYAINSGRNGFVLKSKDQVMKLYVIENPDSEFHLSLFCQEIAFGIFSNRIYNQGLSPHFVQMYGPVISVPEKSLMSLLSKSTERKPKNSFLAVEYFPEGNMLNFEKTICKLQQACENQKKRVPLREEYIHNAIFQIVAALVIAQQNFYFIHKDLHLGNIYIQLCGDQIYKGKRLCDYQFFEYVINGTEHFKIPNLGFIIKIANSGCAKIELNKRTFSGSDKSPKWKFGSGSGIDPNTMLIDVQQFFGAFNVKDIPSEVVDLFEIMTHLRVNKFTARNSAVNFYEELEKLQHSDNTDLFKKLQKIDNNDYQKFSVGKSLLAPITFSYPKSHTCALSPLKFILSSEFLQYRKDLENESREVVTRIKSILRDIESIERKVEDLPKQLEGLEQKIVLELLQLLEKLGYYKYLVSPTKEELNKCPKYIEEILENLNKIINECYKKVSESNLRDELEDEEIE